MKMVKLNRRVMSLIAVAALTTLVMVGGCDTNQSDSLEGALGTAASVADKVKDTVSSQDFDLVQKAATVATELEKSPTRALEILEKNGVTRQEYDAMMKTITSNEALKSAFDKIRASM